MSGLKIDQILDLDDQIEELEKELQRKKRSRDDLVEENILFLIRRTNKIRRILIIQEERNVQYSFNIKGKRKLVFRSKVGSNVFSLEVYKNDLLEASYQDATAHKKAATFLPEILELHSEREPTMKRESALEVINELIQDEKNKKIKN